MNRRGIYKDIGIGGIIYLIIVIGLIILFFVSFILFLRTLLRKIPIKHLPYIILNNFNKKIICSLKN
ncbi:DUF4083 family protein [Bacillus cereus group sp. N12]|uniref:DUF4083 family protein n=1 Tax=Bacillus cereus group TaxID=86661 RepID=UPI000BECB11C|nr:DUF4083 family protein [Bacillus cereus group sp. N12]PDY81824.1 hypothetical protein CON67_31460 [Bacillus toyonensis]